jgi:hypothetical protein
MEKEINIQVVPVGFEFEFEQHPTIEKKIELTKFLSERIGGSWNLQRVFDDEYLYEAEGTTEIRQLNAGIAFNIVQELKSFQGIEGFITRKFEIVKDELYWEVECSKENFSCSCCDSENVTPTFVHHREVKCLPMGLLKPMTANPK